MALTPSASCSLTIRAAIKNRPGMLGRLTSAIGEAGGDIRAVDLVEPVMEGKSLLFKEFANIDAFPVCLATKDVDEIVRTVKHIAPVYGGINLEDISAPRCFAIEERLQQELAGRSRWTP